MLKRRPCHVLYLLGIAELVVATTPGLTSPGVKAKAASEAQLQGGRQGGGEIGRAHV